MIGCRWPRGNGSAIRREHLHRVPSDLDEDAAVDPEFRAEVLDLGSDCLGQLSRLDQVGIWSRDEGSGREPPVAALEEQQRQC